MRLLTAVSLVRVQQGEPKTKAANWRSLFLLSCSLKPAKLPLQTHLRLLTVAEPSARSAGESEAEQAKRGRFRKPLQRRRETPFAQAAG